MIEKLFFYFIAFTLVDAFFCQNNKKNIALKELNLKATKFLHETLSQKSIISNSSA